MSGVGNTASGATIFTENTTSGAPNDVTVANLVVEQDLQVDGNFNVGSFSITDLTVNNDLTIADQLTVGGNTYAQYLETALDLNCHGDVLVDQTIVCAGLANLNGGADMPPTKRLRVGSTTVNAEVNETDVTVTNASGEGSLFHNRVHISDPTNTHIARVRLNGSTMEVGPSTATTLALQTSGTTRATVNATTGQVAITNGIASTSTTTGALTIDGGLGVTGTLYAGTLATGSFAPSSLTTAGVISTTNTTASTNVSTGALIVAGGAGVAGAVNAGSVATTGVITTADTTASTSASTGALVVAGGVGMAGSAYVGQNLRVLATTGSSSTSTGAITVNGGVGVLGKINAGNDISSNGNLIVLQNAAISGNIGTTATTASTSTTTGALTVAGGAGIAGTVNAGAVTATGAITGASISTPGIISTTNTTAATTTTTGALTVAGGLGVAGAIYANTVTATNAVSAGAVSTAGTIQTTNTTPSTTTTTGALVVTGGAGIGGAVNAGSLATAGTITSTDTTASTSSTTGALVVSGGVGIGGNLFVAGTISAAGGGAGGWTNIVPYASVGTSTQIQNTVQIPTTATAITIGLVGVSTTSSTIPYLRFGPTTTMDATGYNSVTWGTSPTFVAPVQSTTQFNIWNGGIAAATLFTSTFTMFKLGAVSGNDLWNYTMAGHVVTQTGQGSGTYQCSSGALRYVTLFAGAGNFDAGSWAVWVQ